MQNDKILGELIPSPEDVTETELDFNTIKCFLIHTNLFPPFDRLIFDKTIDLLASEYAKVFRYIFKYFLLGNTRSKISEITGIDGRVILRYLDTTQLYNLLCRYYNGMIDERRFFELLKKEKINWSK